MSTPSSSVEKAEISRWTVWQTQAPTGGDIPSCPPSSIKNCEHLHQFEVRGPRGVGPWLFDSARPE
eukprot:1077508-Pyramimonas_sp.AAC.1